MRSHAATRNRLAILRALSRFDLATIAELSEVTKTFSRSGLRRAIDSFVAEGLAARDGELGCHAKYAITAKGREEIRRMTAQQQVAA